MEFDPKGVFAFRPDGESRKNAFSTQLDDLRQKGFFALLGKAHPKWWYEADLVEFDPKGVFSFRLMGKVEITRFQHNWTTFVNPAFCATWKAYPKWWYETDLVEFNPKRVLSFRPDWESRKNAF